MGLAGEALDDLIDCWGGHQLDLGFHIQGTQLARADRV